MTENNNTPERAVGSLLRPVAPIADLMAAHGELTEVIQKCMKTGMDYGIIPGTKRETLFKAGAERLLFAFGLYADFEIIEQDVDHDRAFSVKRKVWRNQFKGDKEFTWNEEEAFGLYRFVSKCRLINRKTGEIVGTGTGICSSLESKYSDRPREVENTILKMADKRAMIAATLITFGLSDRFTQDEGDPEAEEVKVEPVKVETEEEKAERLRAKAEADAFRFLRECEYTPEQIDAFVVECKDAGFEKWHAIALQAKAKKQDPREYLDEKVTLKVAGAQMSNLAAEKEEEPAEELVGKALYDAVRNGEIDPATAAEVAQP